MFTNTDLYTRNVFDKRALELRPIVFPEQLLVDTYYFMIVEQISLFPTLLWLIKCVFIK